MKLSIIVPVYNEENTIEEIIERGYNIELLGGLSKEMIIVNDGSTDRTAQLLERFKDRKNIVILHHSVNQGKTAAIKTGLQKVSGDYILIQDADLEYPPEHYNQLLEPILAKRSEVVFGSRFLNKPEGMTWVNWTANRISVLTINVLYSCRLTDFHTGFKVFKAELLLNTPITTTKFSFDTEITCRLLKKHIKILEIPIVYKARKKSEGKKITWPEAILSYWELIKLRFSA